MHGSQVQWLHLIKYIHPVPFHRYLNSFYNFGLSNTFVHDRVHWRLRFEVIVNRRDICFHYAFRNIGRRHIIFFLPYWIYYVWSIHMYLQVFEISKHPKRPLVSHSSTAVFLFVQTSVTTEMRHSLLWWSQQCC